MSTLATTQPAATRPARRALSPWSATLLVAEREILAQVRSKSFLISNAITLLLLLGGIVLSSVLGGGDEDATPVAVVAGVSTAEVLGDAETIEEVSAADRGAAEELVRSGEVDAAIVPDGSTPLGYAVLALDDTPTEIVQMLSVSPPVELLEPNETSSGMRTIIGLGFGLVFMMTAVGSGAMIVQNTVQEKQSRIVEILLAAVPARALLAGKILGNWVIGVGSAAALAATAALGLALTGQTDLLDTLSAPLIWFVVFFLFGFVLIASIFAAGASLVSRQEDTGTVMTPAMMLVMLPYFGVVFFAENETVMTVLSYVPFSAPVGMPVRMFFNEAQWWEPLISLVILLATTAVVVALASKIYTNSLLKTGTRVSVRDALRGA